MISTTLCGVSYYFTMKKMRLRTKIIIAVIAALIVIYSIIGNVIVSAALVPDFMRKLEAFDRVTEQSYSEMVQTDEITENMKDAADGADKSRYSDSIMAKITEMNILK